MEIRWIWENWSCLIWHPTWCLTNAFFQLSNLLSQALLYHIFLSEVKLLPSKWSLLLFQIYSSWIEIYWRFLQSLDILVYPFPPKSSTDLTSRRFFQLSIQESLPNEDSSIRLVSNFELILSGRWYVLI